MKARERNPDELIMLFENTHMRMSSRTHTHDHTHSIGQTHMQGTRADAPPVPDTDSLCPAPLSLKMSSFQQALIFSLPHLSLSLPCAFSPPPSQFATIQKSKM